MCAATPIARKYDTPIHMYMVPKLYISAGVPSNAMADMKLASNDMATGMGCMFPPANRNSFVLKTNRFVKHETQHEYIATIFSKPMVNYIE